jgi:hypothetical protein
LSFQETGRARLRRRLTNKKKDRSDSSITPSIEDLICGTAIEDGPYVDKDYVGLVNRLRSDLAELHPHIQVAVGINAKLPASAVFPFLARKFLELSLTGLLTRIDPLRVISARKNQLDTSYEPGRQNASSVAWTGDILPSDRPPASAWDSQILKKGLERSLLGWHVGEVAIAHGLRWLSDAENSSSDWLRELSGQEKPFDWIRGRLTQLYSTLSKGVHAEYLLDDRTAFDQASIQQHMRDCYMLVLLLATATHISPLFLRSVPYESALVSLRRFEKQILFTSES